MLQFNRYVLRPLSTELCIHVREQHLISSDISSNVHLCTAQEGEGIRQNKQIKSSSTALFIDTDELVSNLLASLYVSTKFVNS
jgi:hypothetical protein